MTRTVNRSGFGAGRIGGYKLWRDGQSLGTFWSSGDSKVTKSFALYVISKSKDSGKKSTGYSFAPTSKKGCLSKGAALRGAGQRDRRQGNGCWTRCRPCGNVCQMRRNFARTQRAKRCVARRGGGTDMVRRYGGSQVEQGCWTSKRVGLCCIWWTDGRKRRCDALRIPRCWGRLPVSWLAFFWLLTVSVLVLLLIYNKGQVELPRPFPISLVFTGFYLAVAVILSTLCWTVSGTPRWSVIVAGVVLLNEPWIVEVLAARRRNRHHES